MYLSKAPKFELGQLVQTLGIREKRKANTQFNKEVITAFQRYTQADWSDMEFEEDIEMNNEALATGETRIFATYNTCEGKIYIVTEWDHSCTTILFPDEY